MHAVLHAFPLSGLQLLEEDLGHEGQDGRKQATEDAQDFVEGLEGVLLIELALGMPEAPAAPPDIGW